MIQSLTSTDPGKRLYGLVGLQQKINENGLSLINSPEGAFVIAELIRCLNENTEPQIQLEAAGCLSTISCGKESEC